ncbi:MAG: hypothetical protein ACP5OA_00765, partial [Candidatus Woesearchaeota archaeon]
NQHNITQENFEYFLKSNFPDYKKHGVIKFLDKSVSRSYDVIEHIDNRGITDDVNLGKVILQYRPDETVLSVDSMDPDGLVAKLMSKNTVVINWAEKKEHYKHQYDKYQ